MDEIRNHFKDILFGVAVGDALGVPVEFESRESILKNLVKDMRGFGTHDVPAGTWSDDSSLTFCLAEALVKGFDLQVIANNFISWLYENYWTPYGNVFDVGIATRKAIERLLKGERPDLAGGFDVSSNGNGSLMRILPLLFYIKDKPIDKRYETVKLVSSITHGHVRSVIACFYYLEFARLLLTDNDVFKIYQVVKATTNKFLKTTKINPDEIKLFDRLLKEDIFELTSVEIKSSGYVLHTLEASIWCITTTNNYKDAVLKAVNLGEDTDTTGAVTGGLAGLLYGVDTVPKSWMELLARKNDIDNLANNLEKKFSK